MMMRTIRTYRLRRLNSLIPQIGYLRNLSVESAKSFTLGHHQVMRATVGQRRHRQVAGQVTAEMAVMLTFVIAGLVGLVVYAQRALQGNLFGGAQAIGLQFDPRDSYSESESLTNLTETAHEVVRSAMVSFELRPVPCSSYDASRVIESPILAQVELTSFDKLHCTEDGLMEAAYPAIGDPDRQLTSLPYGAVYREPTYTETTVDAAWNLNRSATYNDLR